MNNGHLKIIFISGKYRAKTEWELEQNIRHAQDAAIKLWKQGWVVITPHLNTARFGGICPDEVWLQGDIEIMLRCDAVYALNNWRQSEGATKELAIAQKHGLEVIFE